MSSVGANLEAVIIDERETAETEFLGVLKLLQGDDSVAIDSPPGDAISLAVLCSAPILITPKAFAKRLQT
jgi:bifunctional DNase/RNase